MKWEETLKNELLNAHNPIEENSAIRFLKFLTI